MAPDVETVIAVDDLTREAVFRFRQEWARRMPVDLLPHRRDNAVGLQDMLDPMAVVLAVRERPQGRILGAVRTNLLREGSILLYPHLYGLGQLSPGEWLASSVTTCWMPPPVDPRDPLADGAAISLALARKLFDFALSERIRYDFLDCPDAQLPFFRSLGYRHLRAIQHPVRGRSNVMRLDVYDWPHLGSIDSPLLSLVEEGA